MLNSSYFENSRLSILKYCAMILDADSKIIYMNDLCMRKIMRFRGLGIKTGEICDVDLLSDEFDICKFDNGYLLLVDKACGRESSAFPHENDNNLYICSSVFKGKLLIPFLFGNIIEYSSGANVFAGKQIKRNGVLPPVSFTTEVFLINNIAECISAKIKSTAGGKCSFEFVCDESENAAVQANAVDLALMLFLIAWSVLKLADDKRLVISVSVSRGYGAFSFEVNSDKARVGYRHNCGDLFANCNDEREIISSVENIAKIYGWLCLVKERRGKYTFLLSLPSCSYPTTKFKEEEKTRLEEAFDSVYGILDGILKCQAGFQA